MADWDDMVRRPVVYTIPGMDRVTVSGDIPYKEADDAALEMDIYSPGDLAVAARRPAIIYVNGDAPPDLIQHAKDMEGYRSWGRFAGALGFVGITFNHRSSEGRQRLAAVATDVDDLVAYVRAHAADFNVDPHRLCIWTCSGGPPFGLRTVLRDRPPYVRCIVAYYGLMNVQHLRDHISPEVTDATLREFSPLSYLSQAPAEIPPLFVAKAGLDHADLNASIDQFVATALAHNVMIDVLSHPTGQHAFDILDDTARSREIIARTLDFMSTHLLA